MKKHKISIELTRLQAEKTVLLEKVVTKFIVFVDKSINFRIEVFNQRMRHYNKRHERKTQAMTSAIHSKNIPKINAIVGPNFQKGTDCYKIKRKSHLLQSPTFLHETAKKLRHSQKRVMKVRWPLSGGTIMIKTGSMFLIEIAFFQVMNHF